MNNISHVKFFLSSLSSFLGQVNSLGVAFEAPSLATGMGSYIAQVSPTPLRLPRGMFYLVHTYNTTPQPLLRDALERNPAMSKDEARELLERCMKVLFYRDCRSLNKVGHWGHWSRN